MQIVNECLILYALTYNPVFFTNTLDLIFVLRYYLIRTQENERMYSPVKSYKQKIDQLQKERFSSKTIDESIAISKSISIIEDLIKYENTKEN